MSSVGTRPGQKCALTDNKPGHRHCHGPAVTNFFMVGAERVMWEIRSINDGGPYRLSVFHPRGTIVEYFRTTAAAVEREQELETLFLAYPASRVATVCAS